MLLNFTESQIGELLPAFLHIDRQLNISAMGSGISRHMPEVRIGMPCAEAFSVVNFDVAQFFEDGQGVKPIRIMSRSGEVSLSGAAIFHDGGCLLAVRFVLSENVFANGPFDLTDFGHSDPVVLSTMLIALQRAMLEESHATAIELAHERQRSTDLLARTSRVAGYMAHDFNNLLSIVRLNADRLSRQFGSNDIKIGNLAKIIQETASRGSDVTHSLMTLSHQRTDSLQPVSVDDVINENTAILFSVVGSAITLSINLQAEKRKSVVSYNDLLNCIINLLINAREAMPQGGHIDLSTSVAGGVLMAGKNSSLTKQGEYIAICIADNGNGMSDALLSRAFEPLFSSKPNGTGLGLASVRNFAVEMGGDVWLESAAGQGTTVYLNLPVAGKSTRSPTDLSAATGELEGAAAKQRILLVEDEPYALEALHEMLEGEGYAVTPCRSGEEALIALERDTYHVLLTDIVMPGKNGAEVALQAAATQPSIRVILMSGYVPDTASLQPGWMFLNKPMDSTQLLQIISG